MLFTRRSARSTEGSASAERRAAPRIVAYRLDVTSDAGHQGCLLDVSATGARVRFKDAVDVACIAGLRLDFPRWLELGASLEVAGRFVWVRQREGQETEGGFAFDGLSRKASSVIAVLLQRLSEVVAEDSAAGLG